MVEIDSCSYAANGLSWRLSGLKLYSVAEPCAVLQLAFLRVDLERAGLSGLILIGDLMILFWTLFYWSFCKCFKALSILTAFSTGESFDSLLVWLTFFRSFLALLKAFASSPISNSFFTFWGDLRLVVSSKVQAESRYIVRSLRFLQLIDLVTMGAGALVFLISTGVNFARQSVVA